LKKTRLYRAFSVGAVVLTASGALYSATASAAPKPVYLTMVGANATQEVMGAVTTTFNASAVAKRENAKATNIWALPPGKGTVAKSDALCNGGKSITYVQSTTPKRNQQTAPNGSSAGKAALALSVTAGNSCISVVRSSSPGSSSDAAGTQAYAFAVDSVTWSTLSTGAAPKNLSITMLEGVYDCKYTNWDQVGGKNAPIDRYFPDLSVSGIAKFFAGVLNFDPTTLGGINACKTPATIIEQNEATAIPRAKRKDAITIFSGGQWITQAGRIDKDQRAGFVRHQWQRQPGDQAQVGQVGPEQHRQGGQRRALHVQADQHQSGAGHQQPVQLHQHQQRRLQGGRFLRRSQERALHQQGFPHRHEVRLASAAQVPLRDLIQRRH
jgi:phosphate transport system substrate-binding protein